MYRIAGIACFVTLFFAIALEPIRAQRVERNRVGTSAHRSVPDFGNIFTRPIGQNYHLSSDLDLSKQNLTAVGVILDTHDMAVLSHINFSKSHLTGVVFPGYNFNSCDFSGATIVDSDFSFGVHGCNFQDTWIQDTRIRLTREQLLSTASYKAKQLVGITSIWAAADFLEVSFAGFDLRYSCFSGPGLADCDFTDAIIEGCVILSSVLRIEQLLVTRDFKQGFVNKVSLLCLWPEDVVDLSNMVFIDCQFGGYGKINLTDSVISGCNFSEFGSEIGSEFGSVFGFVTWDGIVNRVRDESKRITLENIKSTWNYKHGRMEGIRLPDDIQRALDAEKEQ